MLRQRVAKKDIFSLIPCVLNPWWKWVSSDETGNCMRVGEGKYP